MKTNFWLRVNSRGSINTNKTQPKVNADEVAIYMTIDLPDMLFKKPMLQAKVTIPAEVVPKPEINAQVMDNVAQAIKTATGLEMSVTIKNPEEDEHARK